MHDTSHPRNQLTHNRELLRQRTADLRAACHPLPGSLPYDNLRPINVPARFEGQTLFQCVCAMHPHLGEDQWREWFRAGHILDGGVPASMGRIVRGGHQYWHLFPDTVEPDVDAEIKLLWEDDSVVVVHKPSPLPVHPCGRYNLNTLTSLLDRAYGVDRLRLVHRLDANTTGVMLLAKSPEIATRLRSQFENNSVEKRYLVRCQGTPSKDAFHCDLPITRQRDVAGTRGWDPEGDPARTDFLVQRRFGDGTSLIEARPKTGRTNQIRIHLWALDMPVMGDKSYLPAGRREDAQTIRVGDPPMCLHASQLSFDHPTTQQRLSINAPIPNWAVVS